MEIKNESLRKMLDSAVELKRKQEIAVVEELPSLPSANLSASLEPSLPITREDLIRNTSIAERRVRGDAETFTKAKRKVGRLTTGAAAAVPIVCKGSSCPFRTKCPYFQSGIHETGEDCLVEAQLIEYWTYKYMEELGIDTSSISEMHTLSSLVELAVMDLRMSNYIAINDQDLMMEMVTSIDPNGAPITNKSTSIAFEVKERIDKRRLKILETFNNTREKKAKLLIDAKGADNKSSSRAILDKLDRLAAQVKKEQIVEASYEVL